jgi:hypothetical protein
MNKGARVDELIIEWSQLLACSTTRLSIQIAYASNFTPLTLVVSLTSLFIPRRLGDEESQLGDSYRMSL